MKSIHVHPSTRVACTRYGRHAHHRRRSLEPRTQNLIQTIDATRSRAPLASTQFAAARDLSRRDDERIARRGGGAGRDECDALQGEGVGDAREPVRVVVFCEVAVVLHLVHDGVVVGAAPQEVHQMTCGRDEPPAVVAQVDDELGDAGGVKGLDVQERVGPRPIEVAQHNVGSMV